MLSRLGLSRSFFICCAPLHFLALFFLLSGFDYGDGMTAVTLLECRFLLARPISLAAIAFQVVQEILCAIADRERGRVSLSHPACSRSLLDDGMGASADLCRVPARTFSGTEKERRRRLTSVPARLEYAIKPETDSRHAGNVESSGRSGGRRKNVADAVQGRTLEDRSAAEICASAEGEAIVLRR